MILKKCYCGSDKSFSECCEPYIKGIKKAATAEALMRSRYSAYVTQGIDYLMRTTHISQQKFHSKNDTLNWSVANQWLKLEIIAFTEITVEFKAYFLDKNCMDQIHHEKSVFKLEGGSWYYVDGTFY